MTKQIIIQQQQEQTQLVMIVNGELRDVVIDNQQNASLVGNIYLGTVVRVLVAMQAVFVDIGRQRTAFLSLSEVHRKDRSLSIEQLFYQGERIVVQVIKDELGEKGACLSTKIRLVSQTLVYVPDDDRSLGISAKLGSQAVRERLKGELVHLCQTLGVQGGLIARTQAMSADTQRLQAELTYLTRLWRINTERIRAAKLKKAKHELIHQELPLHLKYLQDLHDGVDEIVVCGGAAHQQLLDFAEQFMPRLLPIIKKQDAPNLLAVYGVQSQFDDVLKRQVMLPSGGFLVIDQTEAMTVIDVNTGSFVGRRSSDELIERTNIEAGKLIARHLRLRNISGIIIIDFIDMISEQSRANVLNALTNELVHDPVQTNILGFTKLGLLEMTRKRTAVSLAEHLTQPCAVCQGAGKLPKK